MKNTILCTLLSATFFVFLFETYLANKQRLVVKRHVAHFGITENRDQAAKRLGVKVSVNGRWYEGLGITPPKNFPIGTFTNTEVIGFKEGDGTNWPVHLTDRFGYFNKNEWWDDGPEMIIVGDSFVTCEHLQHDSITGIIRNRGVKAVNIGLTGSGPILELAALKTQWSYVSNSIKRVVWILYEGNDYQDAIEEVKVPQYAEALNSDYKHHPDPSLLDLMPTTNDQNMYGLRYAFWSIASLKRTRLIARNIASNKPQEIWSESLRQASMLTTNITLIRVGKVGLNTDRQWSGIKWPHKSSVRCAKELYSDSVILAHFNKSGYEALADVIVGNY